MWSSFFPFTFRYAKPEFLLALFPPVLPPNNTFFFLFRHEMKWKLISKWQKGNEFFRWNIMFTYKVKHVCRQVVCSWPVQLSISSLWIISWSSIYYLMLPWTRIWPFLLLFEIHHTSGRVVNIPLLLGRVKAYFSFYCW